MPQCLQCAVSPVEDQPTASPANNALSANVLLPASNTSTKKKNGPPDAADVTGTFLTVSPAHQPHGQTSTLMRHHQMQRQHAMPPYSGTLREHRSGAMTPAGSSKYGGTGHRYDFQNPELIYPQSANSQQFHQLHGKCIHNRNKCFRSQELCFHSFHLLLINCRRSSKDDVL